MKFAAILKSLLLVTAVSLLAACGGGSSGGDSAFQPATVRISATPTATSVETGKFIEIAVKVTQANGSNVADGTVVNSTVTPATNGTLQSIVNGTTGGTSGTTVGGIVNFVFAASSAGNTTLTFSTANGAGASVTTSVAINVTPGQSDNWQMSIELTPEIIPASGRSDVRVRVSRANGAPVADGTPVSGVAFPASAGAFTESTTTTVGGVAVFTYQAQGNVANVELTFSASEEESGRQISASATLQIARVDDSRLHLAPERTSLPVNLHAIDPFLGSPFMAEVTITVKDSNGQPVNCTKDDDGCLAVSINPVGNTGGFTTLDDPETDCEPENNWKGCEFYLRMGKAPLGVTAGKATVFVHSLNFTGRTTLTVTFTDPVTGTTIAAAQEFRIVETSPPLPSQLGLVGPTSPIYVAESGGNNSGQVQTSVMDPLGQPVPDPVSGAAAFNNYQLEILGTGTTISARLRGIDASGATVTGTKLNLRTTAGIGGATFIGGDDAASYVLRLTADRADNNVDNGISDPVTVERSVVVSDGRLYDLEITQPTVSALTINPAGGEIQVINVGGTDIQLPISPDGTYSVTVGVIATDRQGNPVLPGTEIRFGLIDEPQSSGVGDFFLAGGDGDPQEGNTLFTAASGRFMTAGGGAGPGDTLVVFGEEVIGNREMESARQVSQVHSESSLSVDYRFNLNDTTGNNVDYGGVLPYVIGRAADGNIVASAQTNQIGVATTKLNFPVNRIGKRIIIWAQGDRAMGQAGTSPRKVTDVEYAHFAGVAPARLVVSPSVLPANTTQQVSVCLYDALGAPVGGIPVSFAFNDATGVNKVDGTTQSGTAGSLTAFGSGCALVEVSTTGLQDGGGNIPPIQPTLLFAAAGAQATVEFSFNVMTLMASPSMMTSGGTVTLTLIDASGNPLSGFRIVGTCEASGGAIINIRTAPGITNANGQTTAVMVVDNLNQAGGSGSAVCEFQTTDGAAKATVLFEGKDVCEGVPTSPPPAGCDDPGGASHFNLSAVMTAGINTSTFYSIQEVPPNSMTSCSVPGAPSPGVYTCYFGMYTAGTAVTLTAIKAGPGIEEPLWSGAGCTPDPLNPYIATVSMSEARVCLLHWY